MRISRWLYLTVAAAFVAALVAPATASALLKNEWNQQFAGTAACVSCHGSDYNQTSHGQFANAGATMAPGSAMWPVGLSGKGAVVTSDSVIALGAGTGAYEYLKFGAAPSAGVPFAVLTAAWDPASPAEWEIDGVKGVEFEDYGCNQCHHLGAVKKGIKPPAVGNFAATGAFLDDTGTANTWALPASADPAVFASYLPGMSIQCERCHGTGVASNDPSVAGGEHWNVGVKIVGFNTPAMKSTSKAFSTKILDSQVCGQCHGSVKSGNVAGYTPDQRLTSFVGLYKLTDVPTEAQFTADATGYAGDPVNYNSGKGMKYKFFPNGENRSNKHWYYSEWALSGHSVRGALTTASPDALPYQASGASHFSSNTSIFCNRCHTGEGYLKRKGATIMSGWTESLATAGNYGQECATCHVSHGPVGATGMQDAVDKNEPVGMAVRAPEMANGQYSTLGLAFDNKSICEDCHNWQREVANAGAAPALPAISADSSGLVISRYASHPQREIYHARGMLEITSADWKPSTWAAGRTDFMPGAKCEQCHMPATKSDLSGAADGYPETPADAAATGLGRYVDRSAKRYSHRMFIMEPGSAKSWGLAPWGDSCSPCHAGESQDQLQANIDTWQSDAKMHADEASAAIVAAITRGDNVAAGDIDLLKRSAVNVYMYNADSSGGAHNPAYEQAGLMKAHVLAKSAGGAVSMMAPAAVGASALFGIQGVTTNGDHSAAAGVTVNLYRGATLLGTAVTDANGNYAFAFAQTAATTYTVKWARSSQTVSDLVTNATVGMAASTVTKISTDLSLSISRATAKRRQLFTMSGELHGGIGDADVSGASIVISYKRPGSTTWVTWITLTTASDGKFSRTTSLYAYGTYTYRAQFAGNVTYFGSSAQAKITIVK